MGPPAPAPSSSSSTSHRNVPSPRAAPIQARIPGDAEVLQITAVAAEWEARWEEFRLSPLDHKAQWIQIRERHENLLLAEMPQRSKDALAKAQHLVQVQLSTWTQEGEDSEELGQKVIKLSKGMAALTGSLAYDFRGSLTEVSSARCDRYWALRLHQ